MENLSSTDYPSLSIGTLLEARSLYHWHLMHRENVIATAVGRYLIRDTDPWPDREHPTEAQARAVMGPAKKGARTLLNLSVRPYSWPCVLVFVSNWIAQEEFSGEKYDPTQMVPKTLYLPDGRLVPVCIVEAPLYLGEPQPRTRNWEWPNNLIGGGFPIRVDVQGRAHVASVGCLVTDGHSTYALTNRHVVGPAGTSIAIQTKTGPQVVGRSSAKQLTRKDFTELYPEFRSVKTIVNLDVGLIEIDDVNRWTTQIYGIGSIGPMVDLSTRTITLQLIDKEVVAYGAASGGMKGRIKALFYRYDTVAGQDLLTDFLIQPAGKTPVSPRPGDSGTIWCLTATDTKPRFGESDSDFQARLLPRPLAIQWGGHTLGKAGADKRCAYALATNLSSICQQLEVDLIRDWNLARTPFWGKLGHYSIGALAITALKTPALKELMQLNSERISFDVSQLSANEINDALRDADFIPLSDVPDLVWKARVRGLSRGPSENPTHYADVDEPATDGGPTLLSRSLDDPDTQLTVASWRAFYDSQGHTDSRARGLLPFRVWQFFDAMVDYVEKGKVAEFVCAAGILSHYVGDACQTLHGSYLNDGFKDRELPPKVIHRQDGTTDEEPHREGKGVHSSYESDMLDRHSDELLDLMQAALSKLGPATPAVTGGKNAAFHTLRLIEHAQTEVPATDLVESFIQAGGKRTVGAADALWSEYGERTASLMAAGAFVLAQLWESAWKVGKGHAIPKTRIKAIAESKLVSLYEDKNFLRSIDLDSIEGVLKQ